MPQTIIFNPDKYLTSAIRSLKEYVEDTLGLGNANDPYQILDSYPDVVNLAKTKVPFPKTVIHFDIDSVEQVVLGMGDNVVDGNFAVVPLSNPIEETLVDFEVRCYHLVLDVGVWASVESGGPTARMEAREDLDNLFNGPAAYRACHDATEGVEILSFTGGRNVIDAINDVTIFRTVDLLLRVRVYGRFKKFPVPVIEEVTQYPQIVIEDNLIVN